MTIRSQLVWSFLAQAASLGLPPITLLFLVRILSPEDFGIYAMSAAVTSGLLSVTASTFHEVVVQSDKRTTADFSWSIQLVFGVALVTLLYVAAPYIARFYGAEEVAAVVRALALVFLITPFVEIPLFLSMRDLDFRTLFIRQSIGPVASGVVAVGLAYAGLRYWSLVAGQLSGTAISAVLVGRLAGWRPKFNLNARHHLAEVRFSREMFWLGVLRWLQNNLDRVLLGRFQSVAALGYYEMAQRTSTLPFSILAQPIRRVMYPFMARKVRHKADLGNSYQRALRGLLFLALPLTAFMAINSETLIEVILGGKWLAMRWTFIWLSLTSGLAAVVSLNLDVMKAKGRPNIMTRFLSVRTLFTVPIYFVASQSGIEDLALGKLGLALIFVPINMHLVSSLLHTRGSALFRSSVLRPLGLALLTALLCFGVLRVLGPGVGSLTLNAAGFTLVVLLGLLKWERDLVFQRLASRPPEETRLDTK